MLVEQNITLSQGIEIRYGFLDYCSLLLVAPVGLYALAGGDGAHVVRCLASAKTWHIGR